MVRASGRRELINKERNVMKNIAFKIILNIVAILLAIVGFALIFAPIILAITLAFVYANPEFLYIFVATPFTLMLGALMIACAKEITDTRYDEY